jgi:mRNA interferase MazF
MTGQPSVPRRGDIYWVDFSPQRGSEQAGIRPAVVVSVESFNAKMRIVVIAAITSKIKPAYHVTVLLPVSKPLDRESQILAFQLMTVDQSRLGGYLGCLDANQIIELENAMRLALGL